MKRNSLIVFFTSLFVLLGGIPKTNAESSSNVLVETIIENGTVFPEDVFAAYIAVGDVTNDGNPDLVITKALTARAAVFQRSGNDWDNGTLLSGPSLSSAAKVPIIAPIRNDGLNWLVYGESVTGNSGEWLRAHRYDGTTLVENQDITARFGWPGDFSPSVADLDNDGNLEIWFTSQHGSFPNPDLHLRRHEWDANTNSYPGVEIKTGGSSQDLQIRPLTGDFLGDGTPGLIWNSGSHTIDLVTYAPGAGTYDHTSIQIYDTADTNNVIHNFGVGEFDGLPGTDIAVVEGSTLSIISGGTFSATQVMTVPGEALRTVRMADLDGNGLDEIYVAGSLGNIFGYDLETGWQTLATQSDAAWFDGATARVADPNRDEVLFVGRVSGRTFRVVRLTKQNSSPEVDAGGSYYGDEGVSISLSSATALDSDYDPLSFNWSVDSTSCSFSDPTLLNPSITCNDDGSFTVTLMVSDDNGNSTTDSADVTVSNIAPTVGLIIAPLEPVLINTEISASAIFSDPGKLDTHTAVWSWGDDTTSPGTVTEVDGSGSVNGTHAYAVAGVYTIQLTVTDKDGDSGQSIYEFAVAYNPDGGFVTGGGWIWSEPGWCQLDEICSTAEGKANFGFVSKYKEGANVPTGNTEFNFKAGGLNFHSDEYDWLVITGSNYARYKGSGTINGNVAPNGELYKFQIWAGDKTDSEGDDTFRIKIWYEVNDTEFVVYDNGLDQAISGGSIQVHNGK